MSETTETTTQNSAAGWQEAMAASAELQKPKEPAPIVFMEDLPCKLTTAEILQLNDKRSAAETALENLKDEHKAKVADLKSKIASYQQQLRDKQVTRQVRCEERISFAQNRKVSVRLDTNEEFGEEALSSEDRQTLLIPEDKEDGQLTLAQVGDPEPPPFVDESSPDDDGSAPDSTTNMVDDPEGLLLAASTPTDPTMSEPSTKARRNRKAT